MIRPPMPIEECLRLLRSRFRQRQILLGRVARRSGESVGGGSLLPFRSGSVLPFRDEAIPRGDVGQVFNLPETQTVAMPLESSSRIPSDHVRAS